MATKISKLSSLKPLDIKCTNSDCDNELHCFLSTKKLEEENRKGSCRYCGIRLIDWNRVQKRNVGDINFTFKSLASEWIRHYFWHVPIDQKAINHAKRKGVEKIKKAIQNRIRTSIAPSSPFRDGRQTPYSGNSIYYAQHATASCCRKCVEEWHAIPRGQPLSDDEIEYLSELCWRFIKERIPTLTEEGEKIPPLGWE